ncbi:MAG: FAD-dependent oxidoreductase [Gammaproteobacteria bacterium]|nr:FAD-dependent oxidoreductase [Gammaproteobacteria bacterium]
MSRRHPAGVVVVGGGHAAGQLAASLRQGGYTDSIKIVAGENHIPYQRPPLSKQYLQDKCGLERVYLRQAKFYSDKNIECITGEWVAEINVNSKEVVLEDGNRLGWQTLVLATGSSNRILSIPGSNLEGICSLRSISDCDEIKQKLFPGARIAIIGGGYIGLEVAASCRGLGLDVVVIEVLDRVLARVVTPELSYFFHNLHESNGITIMNDSVVESIERSTCPQSVELRLAGGRSVPADLVLVGIGIEPNVELARNAGLPCNDGILVDEYCRTEDESIFAIGDCSNQSSELLGRSIRLECVPSAMEQARCAAATIAGSPMPNVSVPWFWSDQYDVKFQMAGFATEADSFVKREKQEVGSFMYFHFKNDVLLGSSSVNNPGEFLASRRLIGRRIAPDALADAEVDLRSLV